MTRSFDGSRWVALVAMMLPLAGACGKNTAESLGENTGGVNAAGGFASSVGGSEGVPVGYGGEWLNTGGWVSNGGFPSSVGGYAPGIGGTWGIPTQGGYATGIGGVWTSTGGAPAEGCYPVPVEAEGSYPWAPTLPVAAGCSCAATEVCNADGLCVPRCDPEGRCALWLAERAVVSMLLDGTTLYYLTASSEDPLGNPRSDGSLFRVAGTNGVPASVVGGLRSPVRIVGRSSGATYLKTVTGIFEVTDQGALRQLAVPSGWLAEGLMGDALYFTHAGGLSKLPLAASASPAQVVYDPPGTAGLVASDRIWYALAGGFYVFDPLNITPGLSPVGYAWGTSAVSLLGAQGALAFIAAGGQVKSIDENGTDLLVLFRVMNSQASSVMTHTELVGNWLYTSFAGYEIDCPSVWGGHLGRSPIAVGRLPQDLLPPALVSRMVGMNTTLGPFAVGEGEVYWVQPIGAPGGESVNTARYIFHATLPGEPCDAELVCQRTGETCSAAGLCTAP